MIGGPTIAELPPSPARVPPSDTPAAAAPTNNTNNPQPWTTTDNDNDNTPEAAVWRERERRQRTVRVLFLFLVMLLLMDSEEAAQKQQLRRRQKKQLAAAAAAALEKLDHAVFRSRQIQEEVLHKHSLMHARHVGLVQKNGGQDVGAAVHEWVLLQRDRLQDEFFTQGGGESKESAEQKEEDPEASRKVWHYPWNATGFYRGDWTRKSESLFEQEQLDGMATKADTVSTAATATTASVVGKQENQTDQTVDAVALEAQMLSLLRARGEYAGVLPLPVGWALQTRNDNNLTTLKWDETKVDVLGREYRPTHRRDARTEDPTTLMVTKTKDAVNTIHETVQLTQNNGRAAFRLYTRSIPSMQELSLVDGYIKLYDSNTNGYATRRDLLVRVRGVHLHAIGRLSLVSNFDVTHAALVVDPDWKATTHRDPGRRRLSERREDWDESNLEELRDEAWALYNDEAGEYRTLLASFDDTDPLDHRRLQETIEATLPTAASSDKPSDAAATAPSKMEDSLPWSDIVLPYPFVRDDAEESVRKVRTPAATLMSPSEQELEEKAVPCGFEINMNVAETEWTVEEWRKLVSRRMELKESLDPNLPQEEVKDPDGTLALAALKKAKPISDEAVVMTMLGTMVSENCNFEATLNATAIRTNWEVATNKAVNYSFYMMLVCLTQILILLRQLLHSQAQSAAIRVSLLCVGWQTVIDALLCMAHIYLSLVIQPLFTAFASVSFFKLLIFCVIEMKYMAIIMQARNNNAGGQPADVVRRQVAMLHIRFYVAVLGCFILIYYMTDTYRTVFMLGLYSFWVPQIVVNVMTEAKTALHTHYIYWMSITRLVAPLYVYGLRNNFLKEVYPETPYDPGMCQWLVLWVGLQAAVLIAQSKYGARFMIPQRFLPPKFDYNRPLPASMLPPGVQEVPDLDTERSPPPEAETEGLVVSNDAAARVGRHTTTRNRIRGNRKSEKATTKITEESSTSNNTSVLHSHGLECSICYDPIDIRKRRDYMLAPCNHLFHRDCLVQWMDVKMECPICRTELPTL